MGPRYQCARDNAINDNFSAFVARLSSKDFKPDYNEIQRAAFVPWKPLLQAWRTAERPKEFFYACDGSGPEKVKRNLLEWLDTFERGLGMPCMIERKKQLNLEACKLEIGRVQRS